MLLIINLETEEENTATFSPSSVLTLVSPRNEVRFTITPKRAGLIRIRYILSGKNKWSFIQPKDGILFAFPKTISNRLSTYPVNDFMGDNCADLPVEQCSASDRIILSSNCLWSVTGTRGYVRVKVGSLSLPLSLAGVGFLDEGIGLLANEGIKKYQNSGVLTVSKETQDMLVSGRKTCLANKNCSAMHTNADNQFILKRNNFVRYYHNSVSTLIPWWISYKLPTEYNGFHVNDIQSFLIKSHRMIELTVCPHLPLEFTGSYSVLVTHAPVYIHMMSQLYRIDSSYPTCTIVDLCNKISHISFPSDKSLDITSFLRSQRVLNLKGQIKGMGFSNGVHLKTLCLSVWNGILTKEIRLCANATMWVKADLNFVVAAVKLEFEGEIFGEPADIQSVATERFNMEQKAFLKGTSSGSIAINVHGKKLNLIFSEDDISIFAHIGGSSANSCMSCSTKGIHLSLLASNVTVDYEISALSIYPTLKPSATIQAHLYYDIIQGHVISIKNLRIVQLRLRILKFFILRQTRGIQMTFMRQKAQYKLELDQLTKVAASITSKIQKAFIAASKVNPEYKDVFNALENAKEDVALFVDALVGFKEAVHSIERNNFIKKRVDAQVINLKRFLQKRLFLLEVVPKSSSSQEIHQGLSISYAGKVCIYNLCFYNSIISIYDLEKGHACKQCWNTTEKRTSEYTYITASSKKQRQLGPYVRVKSGRNIDIQISKTTDDFFINLPATVSMFEQHFDVIVRVDKNQMVYRLQNVNRGNGFLFDITAKADFSFTSSWNSISFSYEGKASIASTLASSMESIANVLIKNVANRTIRRINETRAKLANSKMLIEKYNSEVTLLKADLDEKDNHRRLMIGKYKQANLNITTIRKNFRSAFPGDYIQKLEEKLNASCIYQECKKICYTMALYDMCQDKEFILANELRCDQVEKKVRSTVEVPFKTDCDMTKRNFIPIYTGTCRKGDQEKLQGSMMGIGAGAGALNGTAIRPGIGTVVAGYKVFKEVINYQVPCALKRYNTRTKVFSVSVCYPVQRLILSDYGIPYPCPVSNSTCIPIINPQCLQKNNECRKLRDVITRRELENAGVFNKTWAKMNYYEIKMTENIVLMNKAERIAAEARRKYERKKALLKEAELEANFSQSALKNVNLTLSVEKCLMKAYDSRKLISFNEISFKTSTPVAENLFLELYVVGGKAGRVLIEFQYVFDDQETSVKQGVRKIIQKYLCSGYVRRRRRSIIENIAGNPLGHHHDYPFSSFATGEEVKDSEAVCLSSKTVFGYFEHLVKDLKKSIDLAIKREKELRIEISGADDIIKSLNAKISDPVVYEQFQLMHNERQNAIDELNQFEGSNVFFKWKQDMEIYTEHNNFSACLHLKDCIETGLENLRELPSMFSLKRSDYNQAILRLEIAFNKIMVAPSNIQAFNQLALELDNAVKMKSMTSFCSRGPQVRLTSPIQLTSFVGQLIELQCIANSALPVSYAWMHGNKTLPFETQSKLKIFVQPSSVGSYTCVAWNLIGRNSSDETFVVLRKKPYISEHPKDFTYLEIIATKVKPYFACNVTSDPPAKITWYFQPFSQQTNRLKLHTSKPVLTISKPTLGHNGFYYCVASNQYGSVTSRRARLDVLNGGLPNQELSVSFDIKVGHVENVNKAFYEKKIKKDSRLSQTQSIGLDLEAANSKEMKFGVKVEDHGNTEAYGMDDINMLRKVSKTRQSLSEGVQRLVSGFVDSGDQSTAAVMEKSMKLGYDGGKCNVGSTLHKNGFTCVLCPAGTYEFSRRCLQCDVGTYQPQSGQTRCLPCDVQLVTQQKGSLSRSQCQTSVFRAMDIIMLLDTSDSFNTSEFTKVRQFVSDVVDNFINKNNDVKFGLISYSRSAKSEIPFAFHDNNIMADISRLSMTGSTIRRTDQALHLAVETFKQQLSGRRRRVLITLTGGRASHNSAHSGFDLTRIESLKLHQLGIESTVVGIGNRFDKNELLAMASSPKQENIVMVTNGISLLSSRQSIISTVIKGQCDFTGTDIAFAIQSSSSISDKSWTNALTFVTNFVKKLKSLRYTKFGLLTFGAEQLGSQFRSFFTNDEVDAVVSKLARVKNQVNIPKTLEFLFNSYVTEKYNSLFEVKIVIVLSEGKISDDTIGNLRRSFPDEDVKLLNVIVSFDKQDAGVSEIGIEESRKTRYSLSELSEIVERVKCIKPRVNKLCQE